MALLERVAALVRANLNDLIDKAEDPEKMIKQIILDIQNQLLQVKTQVAIAIGERMFLAEKTVKNYVSNLLSKLGMERRTEAAVFAARLKQGSSDDRGA